jgi:anti-sigma B factor antagonist
MCRPTPAASNDLFWRGGGVRHIQDGNEFALATIGVRCMMSAMTSSGVFSDDDRIDLVPATTGVVSVAVEHHGAAVVMGVSGEVDVVTAPHLQEAIALALANRPAVLIVDLTDVAFLASAGMAVLVSSGLQAGEHTRFRVVAAGPVTFRPMELIGVTREIALYPTLEDALRADCPE